MSQVKLGDVAVESRETYKGDKTGMPIVGLEHITPGEVTLSSWDTNTENTFTKRFRKGDMLFGRRRAYLKKAAQAPFDGICSGDITVIRAKEDILLPELLPFIIQNDDLFDFAVDKSAGSLSPRVKWENLKNYPFNLPPIEEQKKLATVLWSINDTLQAYQKLLNETDELVKSQFIEHSAIWEKSYNEHPLEEYLEMITYGFTNPMPDSEDGPWKITAKDITCGIIDFNTARKTEVEAFEQLTDKSKPKIGDVLLTKDGTLGHTAIVNRENICINQSVALLRCNRKMLPEFLCCILQMPIYQHKLLKDAGGVTIKHLYITRVNKMNVLVPDIETQSNWVQFLKQTDKSKAALQSSITSLQETKRCLLANTLWRKE